MTSPSRGFQASEFRGRTRAAQNLMVKHGLSALLLTTEPEIRYYTGFLTRFVGKPDATVVRDCSGFRRSDCGYPVHWCASDGAELDSQISGHGLHLTIRMTGSGCFSRRCMRSRQRLGKSELPIRWKAMSTCRWPICGGWKQVFHRDGWSAMPPSLVRCDW